MGLLFTVACGLQALTSLVLEQAQLPLGVWNFLD